MLEHAKWKNNWDRFDCNADQRFDTKVKCQTKQASFWFKFPTLRSKNPGKCPGMPGGMRPGVGGGVLALTGTYLGIMSYSSRLGTSDVVSNWIVLSGVFFIEIVKNLISFVNKKVKIDMLSKQQQIARFKYRSHFTECTCLHAVTCRKHKKNEKLFWSFRLTRKSVYSSTNSHSRVKNKRTDLKLSIFLTSMQCILTRSLLYVAIQHKASDRSSFLIQVYTAARRTLV